jgi:hypothetical protein
MLERDEKCVQILVQKREGKTPFGELGVGERIVFGWIIREQCEKGWI